MGTCNLQERKIQKFWSDTLSSFCKNILKFKEECRLQGNLCLTLDKKTSLKLNINTKVGSINGKDSISDNQLNRVTSETNEAMRQNEASSGTGSAEIVADPESGIHSFLNDSLLSFCKNMIEFSDECTVQAKLCITIDKENAMLVEIHETVHGENWTILSDLLSPDTCKTHNAVYTSADIFDLRHHSSVTSPIVITPDGIPDCTKQLSDCKRQEVNITKTSINGCQEPMTSFKTPTKRKRKQANPVSLRNLESMESNPKIIVVTPEEPSRKIAQVFHSLNDKFDDVCQNNKTRNAPNIDTMTLESNNANDYCNLSPESHFIGDTNISNQVPLMVHMLQQQTLAQLNSMKHTRPDVDTNNLPALVSKASTMGNLDMLAEKVSVAYSGSMSNILPTPVSSLVCNNKPSHSAFDQADSSPLNMTVSKYEGSSPKATAKSRYVNSLLDVPDDEVQQMLMALITSGQTKEACETKQCHICCPTLAYIRFRDRNRKNKSRFSMEKIEQVVNVKQYGGGSKYRDVQRMFTTHLRKLRAKHMCDKKCLCCEKLLLRESKKPNSNYLPHNVVPYKNLQHKIKVDLDPDDGAESPLCT